MFRVLLTCGVLWSASLVVAQEEDDELAPGLVAVYASGQETVTRIDGDLAFDGQNLSPDLRLTAGPFSARWHGQILLRAEGKYRWHAYLSGQATVRVGGQVVLQGRADKPGWISGAETELSFGEFPLEIAWARGDTGRFLLCWSSDQFPLEPLPHHVLFHERSEIRGGSIPPAAIAISQHRCDRCHGDIAGLKSSPGPSLRNIGAETSETWLLDQIRNGGGEQGHMPTFGFTKDDAAAILSALQAAPQPAEFPITTLPAELAPKDVETGRELLVSAGCLACHQWEKQGRAGDFGGPPLDEVGKHRTAAWLELWLTDPAKINPQHRMPVFTLSNDERRQIVSALIAPHPRLAASRPVNPSPESLQRGEKLIRESRCAACHELPGVKREVLAAPRWTDLKLTDDGCWSKAAQPESRRPQYTGLRVDELRSFLESARTRKITPSADLAGQFLLLEKGCLNCHDRDGRQGISAIAKNLASSHPKLEGRAPWLIPPQLTAVGDRLPDERLAKAIRGELPKRRLDWLLVRMPKYQHTESEQAALMAHLIGHDRIPEKAPTTPVYPRSDKQEATHAGRELLGGKGFSCVACHPVKDFSPKNVALGTRGSNLFEIGERLRPDYFFRWTRSPLRVMPGVEMPSYQRPHATIFPGDLNRQLASIWTALNDPDLPTPVNPGAVEQYWIVGKNDPPRILRDVVTLPGNKEITMPRAFAVGFPNGHNILFDLDTASVRAWTIGDFAQQRTQGKSWFWDLVGTPVMVSPGPHTEIVIASHDGKVVYFPSPAATVSLKHTRRDDDGAVSFRYEISWPALGEREVAHQAEIEEAIRPEEHGFRRRIRLLHFDPDQAVIACLAWPAGARMDEFQYDVFQIIDEQREKLVHGKSLTFPFPDAELIRELTFQYTARPNVVHGVIPQVPSVLTPQEPVTAVPGFNGKRLPYPTNIMPTAITFNHAGRMFFTSLKGHVYSADEREAKLFAEGLAAPFGILDSHDMVLVAHKPEIVGLVDSNKDGQADEATVIATGWGLTDDYHDWTCGLVRDAEGNLFTTLGSDYAHKNRPKEKSRWRGHLLKIDPAGKMQSLASGLRYTTGIALTSEQHLFLTDQQGVQNTFNELNWLSPRWGRSPDRASPADRRSPHQQGQETQNEEAAGSGDPRQTGTGIPRFGVPSLHEPDKDAPATPPAVQIPHPWTRSVNGITAIPKSLADRTHPKLFDQLIGCEYDTRFLVRFSWQLVDGEMQGAVYPFSKPVGSALRTDGLNTTAQTVRTADPTNGLQGPLCIAVAPEGDLYVGSIHDSGWQGGLNTGDIVKLTPQGTWPNGLAEIRSTPTGFDLEFFHPLDAQRASDKSKYQISGYTRVWQGAYATPDTGRHAAEIQSLRLSDDAKTVSLSLAGLKPGHVYDISVGEIGTAPERALWPNIGFYTLHRIPSRK